MQPSTPGEARTLCLRHRRQRKANPMILFDQAGAGARAASLFAAPPRLRPFAEHFWTLRKVATFAGQPWRIPPDANPYLIFTASESVEHDLDARCILVGPGADFVDIPVHGRVFTCGIRLRPGVLPLLTRSPACELTNGAVTVEDAFGSRGRELLERLGEATAWDHAPECMAGFLSRALAGVDAFQPFPVDRADSVGGLAEVVGLSIRTLHHRIQRQVGISPKHWLRIERLHRAIACSAHHAGSWSDIAARCGFADQAHMVREFVDLLGESPGTWIKRSPFLPSREPATEA